MTFTVKILYDDGPAVQCEEAFDDRATALDFTLDLAENLGRTFSSGDRGWPQWVSIFLDGKLDLSIQVIKGGLSGRAPQQGLIDL